jgi:hypothetical protein
MSDNEQKEDKSVLALAEFLKEEYSLLYRAEIEFYGVDFYGSEIKFFIEMSENIIKFLNSKT